MNDQYKSPGANMNEGEGKREYMGFWLRAVAFLVDNIWVSIVLLAVILGLVSAGLLDVDYEGMNVDGVLLQFLIPFILVIMLWIRYASTPGKMIFRAKILDADTYEAVPTGRLLIRYIGYFVSAIPLFLGFFWIAFDDKKQGFHDKLARTVVVKGSL